MRVKSIGSTLASLGDGVIATDPAGNVTFALYAYVFIQLRCRAKNLWGDYQAYCATGQETEAED